MRTGAVEPDHAHVGIANKINPVLEDRDALRADDSLVDRARLLAGRALAYEGLSQWEAALNDYNSALDLAKQAGWGIFPLPAYACMPKLLTFLSRIYILKSILQEYGVRRYFESESPLILG